ncbi:dapper homolog 3-like [Lutra lutra]|uniref:dapper homolog 3-like n=1 Tax=Lutra lutra TaxID=9657 RepID=UPI001FD4AB44|nr:dapper homolog 3-like [Lutra lutra]
MRPPDSAAGVAAAESRVHRPPPGCRSRPPRPVTAARRSPFPAEPVQLWDAGSAAPGPEASRLRLEGRPSPRTPPSFLPQGAGGLDACRSGAQRPCVRARVVRAAVAGRSERLRPEAARTPARVQSPRRLRKLALHLQPPPAGGGWAGPGAATALAHLARSLGGASPAARAGLGSLGGRATRAHASRARRRLDARAYLRPHPSAAGSGPTASSRGGRAAPKLRGLEPRRPESPGVGAGQGRCSPPPRPTPARGRARFCVLPRPAGPPVPRPS